MNSIKNANLPQMSVDKFVSQISRVYCEAIKKDMPMKKVPSVMLWGPPGVGKSQAIRQIKSEIESHTSKKVNITDVRLLLFNPIDLRGIPTANADKTLAIWLKPQIFQMDDSCDVINILFLDEISAAPQSVQAAAYQITLDRVVGEHKLPDNCIVVAAGNRITDKSVSYKMPKALANRLMHIEIESNFDSWIKWAISNNINPKILGFLAFRRTHLITEDVPVDDLAYATPRSWEMVSNIMNLVSDDVYEMYDIISGLIGKGVAYEFRTWSKIYSKLPNVEDIFKGNTVIVPKELDILYALVYAIIDRAKKYKDDMTKIANVLKFSELLPPDFGIILFRDIMYLEKDYKNKLLRIPEFVRILNSRGKFLNAAFGE